MSKGVVPGSEAVGNKSNNAMPGMSVDVFGLTDNEAPEFEST